MSRCSSNSICCVSSSFPVGQSRRRVWCRSGSAGRPAVCPVGWAWGPESDTSNSIPRTARSASSTRRRRRSVWSTTNAVSLSFCLAVWVCACVSVLQNLKSDFRINQLFQISQSMLIVCLNVSQSAVPLISVSLTVSLHLAGCWNVKNFFLNCSCIVSHVQVCFWCAGVLRVTLSLFNYNLLFSRIETVFPYSGSAMDNKYIYPKYFLLSPSFCRWYRPLLIPLYS